MKRRNKHNIQKRNIQKHNVHVIYFLMIQLVSFLAVWQKLDKKYSDDKEAITSSI
jgi:hypothetical protein